MGNGEWEEEERGKYGKKEVLIIDQFSMPNTQCPIPNAQCPMPNAQFPIPNFQIPEKSYTIMSYAGVGAEASSFIDDN
ncbi:MAG: hypothetical protein V7K98_15865 [Nostoc sp.]|uniref:hypothetical protein n=1 Tax=Nostoc sp. TaxID=1180 RepID=UPI002FF7551B